MTKRRIRERKTPMRDIETVTLGMGCFWGPEALFGSMPGVIRTRTGYVGGTAADPTYREMGDHSETVEIDFDPEIVALERILETFWDGHNPDNINGYKGRQYQSLIFYRDPMQEETIQSVKSRFEHEKGTLATEIHPFSKFHLAEDRHQKYYLKRFPDAMAKLGELYPDPRELADSTLAARLNGLAKGYTNLEPIRREIASWPVKPKMKAEMLELVGRIRW